MKTRFKRISLTFHTIRYLKFEQLWFRFYYHIVKLDYSPIDAIPIRNEWYWSGPTVSEQTLFSNKRVRFLSVDGYLTSSSSWNDPDKDRLWLYNLHYFDDLNSASYKSRKKLHLQLIDKWIVENPFGRGTGWEPYPLSLRLINWVKWFSRHDFIEPRYLVSIAEQSQALLQRLEYHILGNHLFANAKALVFIGSFLKGKLSDDCFRKGLDILDREVREQFLEDGAHFELSPMYHSILLWDLLELIHLASVTQSKELLDRLVYWRGVANKSLCWLQAMAHPDGEISFFNDSAIGIAAKPAKIFAFAKHLGLTCNNHIPKVLTFRKSGYSRISSTEYTLIMDHGNVGPDYLPGHAHADTLSYELSVGEQRVFVNSGTSLYGVSQERLRQRKTAAHNTVEVDGQDSSEVWSGFRVARRANVSPVVVGSSDDEIRVSSSHTGYLRLPGRVLHSRTWICKENTIKIVDSLSGHYKSATAFFHLHPSIEVIQSNNVFKLVLLDERTITLESTELGIVENTTWHPEFGLSFPTKRISISFVAPSLEVKICF